MLVFSEGINEEPEVLNQGMSMGELLATKAGGDKVQRFSVSQHHRHEYRVDSWKEDEI